MKNENEIIFLATWRRVFSTRTFLNIVIGSLWIRKLITVAVVTWSLQVWSPRLWVSTGSVTGSSRCRWRPQIRPTSRSSGSARSPSSSRTRTTTTPSLRTAATSVSTANSTSGTSALLYYQHVSVCGTATVCHWNSWGGTPKPRTPPEGDQLVLASVLESAHVVHLYIKL